jgi:hypothetical protein
VLRIWRWAPLLLLAAAAVGTTGCRGDACRGGAPSFQLDIALSSRVDGRRVSRLLVTVDAAGLHRQAELDVTGLLDDQLTSVAITVGLAGARGFEATVEVVALDPGGTVLARGSAAFEGSGDACNFFGMAAAPVDAGVDRGERDRGLVADAAGRFDSSVLPRPGCTEDGWCWSQPLPQGNTLRAVWAASATELWAAGDVGALLHWQGGSWELSRSGTQRHLRALWGSGPKDLWAAGDEGTLLHGDGTVWTSVPSGTTANLNAISGCTSTDAWAVGDGGVALRWDGKAWSSLSTGSDATLRGVWCARSDSVWAVGDEVVLRWNGSAWASVLWNPNPGFQPKPSPFNAVWGPSPDEVWIAAGPPTLNPGSAGPAAYRWTQGTWKTMFVDEFADGAFTGVWGGSASNVWVVWNDDYYGRTDHWDGVTWTETSSLTARYLAVGGTGGAMVFVGIGGAASLWDGSWKELVPSLAQGTLRGVWGSGAELWATGDSGRLLHFTPSAGWTLAASYGYGQFSSIWGFSPTDILLAGKLDPDDMPTTLLARWKDGAWTTITTPFDGIQQLWASSPADIWVLDGHGAVRRWNGVGWEVAPVCSPACGALWGTSSTDLWTTNVIGAEAYHWDGTGWTTATTPPSLTVLRATADGEFWGAGKKGALARYRSGGWQQVPGTLPTDTFHAIYGLAADDVWIAGDAGVILHWDGAQIGRQQSGTDNALRGLWATGPGAAWVVGDHGTILRHDK